jgi:hypothetical protein
MADYCMDSTYQLLVARYKTIAEELEAIKGSHPANQLELKTQDGGTSLLKYQKIKQLEESLAAAAKAIKDHIDLCNAIEAGPIEPWTIETQLEL